MGRKGPFRYVISSWYEKPIIDITYVKNEIVTRFGIFGTNIKNYSVKISKTTEIPNKEFILMICNLCGYED